MLAQGDDTQRSHGEYSKYGHDKLTAHEESANKEISILTYTTSTIAAAVWSRHTESLRRGDEATERS